VILKSHENNPKYSRFGKLIPNLSIGPIPAKGMKWPKELSHRY